MSSSSRILHSRSKGSSTPNNADNGETQLEAKELTMVECNAGAKKKQVRVSVHQSDEHSSLERVTFTDGEDLFPNGSLVSPAQRKKKSAKKLSGEVNLSQEKEKLPFECKNCGRAFKVETYLRKHLAVTCRVEPRFPCRECSHQFKWKKELRNHLMKKHDVEKSQLALYGAGPMIRPVFPFKCHKCQKTYKLKSSLIQHLKFVCDVDPSFPCTLCDYRASRKCSLRDHLMAVHSVDRSQFSELGAEAPETRPVQPFKSEMCGRTYKQKHSLAQHLKYECGVNPTFLCTQCDYRASQKSYLKQHLSTFILAPVFPSSCLW